MIMGNKDGGQRHRGSLWEVQEGDRIVRSYTWKVEKGMHSNPKTFFSPGTRDGDTLQLNYSFPGIMDGSTVSECNVNHAKRR